MRIVVFFISIAIVILCTLAASAGDNPGQGAPKDEGIFDGFYLNLYGGVTTGPSIDAVLDPSPRGISPDGMVEFDAGLVGGGAIGLTLKDPFHIGGNLRPELEGSYRKVSTDQQDFFDGRSVRLVYRLISRDGGGTPEMSSASFMVNTWYDLPVEGPMVPYVGGGAGVSYIGIGWDDEFWSFAYQFGGGVRAKIADWVSGDIRYRNLRTGLDQEVPRSIRTVQMDTSTHEILFGLTFELGR